MIEVIGLTKQYNGYTAVDDLSFQVAEGETLGLIGTSGCGKTTTLKMLNLLIQPTSGCVLMGGQDIRQVSPEKLRQRIGYVIQEVGLFPHFTVAENIAVVPRLLHWKEKHITQRTLELLERLGLPADEFAQRYPHELSGGQQQRVGIARALAANPPVVLLDEPFGALDQIIRRQIQQEFKHLESMLQKTMVLVTHDIFEAILLCDSLCLMNQGKVQQLGAPKDLLFAPQNDFVAQFFDASRFQLELQVTLLQDLLPRLSQLETQQQNIPSYQVNDSLLSVLEERGGTAGAVIEICPEDSNHGQIVSCDELLQVFCQLKQEGQLKRCA